MNEAHIHLMVNHLPVIGLFLASVFLAYALLRRNVHLLRPALWMVFLTALSGVPAYFSGEGAEVVVEGMAGISEAMIEDHEETAEIALIISQLTGLLALATALVTSKSERFLRLGSAITLAAALGSFGLMGLVASTGGKISHPELRVQDTGTQATHGEARGERSDDDD